MEYTAATIIFIISGYFLSVYITRWIFRIDRQLKNQKAIFWFLMKLCERQGVPADEIKEVKDYFNIK